ncbi:MAG: TIM barrel protein [Fusobacterium sp. JB021]|nr:TIM barrel protein [Fusobacterium sp. JB021]MDP0506030.1 TIM barrel protein [Fusobacterium sp. JB019]
MEITGAPGCWGVEDCNNPYNPNWKKVLNEASRAGYSGLELGPYGYMPLDANILDEELKKRNLKIVAGTMYDDLSSFDNFDYLIEKTKKICKLLSKLEKENIKKELKYNPPYLVVIDEVNPSRSKTSGLSNEAIRLDDKKWKRMMYNISEISKIANSYGVRAVLHPHAGGHIEFADEIDRAAKDLNNELIGFCLDTGHLYYSGMNPIEWLEKYYERLDYIHFKDINKEIYDIETKKHTGFFESCALGVMCPIGKGILSYSQIYKFLKEKNYKGYITIEQERDPRNSDTSFQDVKESIDYLKKIGF